MSVWPIGQRVRLVHPATPEEYGKEGVIEFYRPGNEAFFECDPGCCDCAVSYDTEPSENNEIAIYTHHTDQLEPITSH